MRSVTAGKVCRTSPSEDRRTSRILFILGASRPLLVESKIPRSKPLNYKENPLSDRAPLSAVLITRDAAAQLDACLASVAFCAEILVVDSGSTDGTVAIAQARGAKVINHAWLATASTSSSRSRRPRTTGRSASTPTSRSTMRCARRSSPSSRPARVRVRDGPLQPFPRPLAPARRGLSRLGDPPFSSRPRAVERRHRARAGADDRAGAAPCWRPAPRLGRHPRALSREAEPLHHAAGRAPRARGADDQRGAAPALAGSCGS